MKIYLELTTSEYRMLKTVVEQYRTPEACPACKKEYGQGVVRLSGGHAIAAWQGTGHSPTRKLLETVLAQCDLQLEVAEYEGLQP